MKLAPIALAATLVTFSLAPAAVYAAETSQSVQAAAEASPVAVNAGKMIYGPNGQRIAPAYRVTSEGTVQVILNGKLVNIPASTLSDANGKVTTSLTKKELTSAR
jgi:hypothetical protein